MRVTEAYPGEEGKQADHHRLPQPELLRQRRVRHQGCRAQLLRRRGPQPADARPGRAAGRHSPVALVVRPGPQRTSSPTTARSTFPTTSASRSSSGATTSCARWPTNPSRMVLTERRIHARGAPRGDPGGHHPDSPGARAAAVAGAALHLGPARRAGRQAVRRRARPARELERGGLRIISSLDATLQSTRREVGHRGGAPAPRADPEAYAAEIGVPYEAWMRKLGDLRGQQRRDDRHGLPDGRDPGLCRAAPAITARTWRRRSSSPSSTCSATAGGSPDRRSSRSTT